MGLRQCFLIFSLTLMLPAQLAVSFPQREVTQYHVLKNRSCKMCPAGEYQKTCTECAPCPTGSFTAEQNQEDRCSRCSGDCRPEFHLKVIQTCTEKSDLKCVCEEGYTCIEMVPYSDNCRYCKKITAEAATNIPDKRKKETPSFSSGNDRATVELCNFHKCDPEIFLATQNGTNSQTDKMTSVRPPTVLFLFAGGCVALLVLVYSSRLKSESCFKKTVEWFILCNKGGRKASHKSKESTHHFPQDSFRAQQPLPLSAANLGPVHVHNPGTIIFSLLSQFTGQVGPTIETGTTAETGGRCDDRDGLVFQPAPSPRIHISEEERSEETDSIFFPSQEQGKDCHVSKEEAL